MIVLVGVPGAGKSTVGRKLAERLKLPFIDIDDLIVEIAGKPISDIFTDDGEDAFRNLEAQTIQQTLSPTSAVVSLGGGALGNEATRKALKNHTVVWLKVSLAGAVDRVGMNRNRPLLLGNVRGKLNELMLAREPIYRECATIEIDTTGLNVNEVVEELKRQVEGNKES